MVSGDEYCTVEAVAADLELISANCLRFNSGEEDAEDFVECAHAFRKHVSIQLAIIKGEKPEPELAPAAGAPKVTATMKKVALVVAQQAARDSLSHQQAGPKRRGRPPKAETVLLKARMNAAVAASRTLIFEFGSVYSSDELKGCPVVMLYMPVVVTAPPLV